VTRAASPGPGPLGAADESQDALVSQRRYRRMLLAAVPAVSVVAVVPLLIMATVNYHQYQQAASAEVTRPMVRFTAVAKQSLESFLSERLSTLAMVVRQTSFDDLRNQRKLDSLLVSVGQAFGGFVDLGVIDEDGIQVAYAGPFQLKGRSYADHPWFREVSGRGEYVSDVFLGYRHLPHIVVAVQRRLPAHRLFVLRATLDADVFHWLVRSRTARSPEQSSVCRRCHALGVLPTGDAFIINQAGVLQTASRTFGDVLSPSGLPPLPYSTEPRLIESRDGRGEPLILSYAQIERSPFVLVVATPAAALPAGWQAMRRRLLLVPAASSLLILALVVAGTVWVVRRARQADLRRAALFHKMEYTNKLAAIGRLGAGVAHEINNPLSIITEKAGLLKDLLTMSATPPSRERLVELTDAILQSAERCGGITHRLLGFARHMEVRSETIELDRLLKEVLAFLEKEASYRGIQIVFEHAEAPPPIVSDRGQLQQVFLNLINNAFAAVDDGGRIAIDIRQAGADAVAVSIADNGVGIPKEHLDRIFDPFFTTKKGAGTGLGLSITHGIIEKLGGQIAVESTVGKGTRFTVTLPLAGAPA
jgi:two-component system NtrC family sensor kinase